MSDISWATEVFVKVFLDTFAFIIIYFYSLQTLFNVNIQSACIENTDDSVTSSSAQAIDGRCNLLDVSIRGTEVLADCNLTDLSLFFFPIDVFNCDDLQKVAGLFGLRDEANSTEPGDSFEEICGLVEESTDTFSTALLLLFVASIIFYFIVGLNVLSFAPAISQVYGITAMAMTVLLRTVVLILVLVAHVLISQSPVLSSMVSDKDLSLLVDDPEFEFCDVVLVGSSEVDWLLLSMAALIYICSTVCFYFIVGRSQRSVLTVWFEAPKELEDLSWHIFFLTFEFPLEICIVCLAAISLTSSLVEFTVVVDEQTEPCTLLDVGLYGSTVDQRCFGLLDGLNLSALIPGNKFEINLIESAQCVTNFSEEPFDFFDSATVDLACEYLSAIGPLKLWTLVFSWFSIGFVALIEFVDWAITARYYELNAHRFLYLAFILLFIGYYFAARSTFEDLGLVQALVDDERIRVELGTVLRHTALFISVCIPWVLLVSLRVECIDQGIGKDLGRVQGSVLSRLVVTERRRRLSGRNGYKYTEEFEPIVYEQVINNYSQESEKPLGDREEDENENENEEEAEAEAEAEDEDVSSNQVRAGVCVTTTTPHVQGHVRAKSVGSKSQGGFSDGGWSDGGWS